MDNPVDNAVLEAVAEAVADAVAEAVAEAVAKAVAEAVAKAVVEGVAEAVAAAVAAAVAKAVAKAVGEAVVEGVAEAVGEGVGKGVVMLLSIATRNNSVHGQHAESFNRPGANTLARTFSPFTSNHICACRTVQISSSGCLLTDRTTSIPAVALRLMPGAEPNSGANLSSLIKSLSCYLSARNFSELDYAR